MKARLRALWFPRLRAARAGRDYWMVAASWARVEHQLAAQAVAKAKVELVAAVEMVAEQNAAMRRQAGRHLALHAENRALCNANARLRSQIAATEERVSS